jgi:ABC-2 type transport system ATP-binding protein
MSVASAIEITALAKTYGKNQVLHPLSLSVPQGSVYALVGHNGAGKTTLIKMLLNIIQPTSGSATVLGEPATQLRGEAFTRIGYVSENQEMPEWMTVQEFMDYLRPFYPAWDDANLFADLSLPPDRKLRHLSRGMRMKAALASVLAFRPSLIVMDEPFSGLDPLVRDELIETLLDRLNDTTDSGGTTVLISSHDLGEIESFATHVAFLHEGRLLFAEPLDTLTARFREVTVTLAPGGSSASAPLHLPEGWLLPKSTASVFHFVHSDAETDLLEEQIRTVLPRAIDIQTESMTLRTIFLALVKSHQLQDRSRA